MGMPTLPPRRVDKSKKNASPDPAVLGAAATAFLHGAGIGMSMMIFQAFSAFVAKVRRN